MAFDLTRLRLHVDPASGDATVINKVDGSNCYTTTGGTNATKTNIDAGGGKRAWRYTGNDSAPGTYTSTLSAGLQFAPALSSNSDPGVVFGIRARIQVAGVLGPDFRSIFQLGGFSANGDGMLIHYNKSGNSMQPQVDVVATTAVTTTLGTFKSIICRITPSSASGTRRLDVWYEGGGGTNAPDLTATGGMSVGTLDELWKTVIDAQVDVAVEFVLRPVALASDADCRAAATDIYASLAPAGPVLSAPTVTGIAATTATIGATTNTGSGNRQSIVATSATPPALNSGADGFVAGAYAYSSGIVAVGATGAFTSAATGLAPSTTYYAHHTHRAAGASSATLTSASFRTAPALSGNAAPTIPENTTTIGTYGGGEAGTYGVTGTDASFVTIGSSSGIASFIALPNYDGTPPDAGANNVYNFNVTFTATSSGLSATPFAVAVTVTDVNESPTFVGGSISFPTLVVGTPIAPLELAGRWTDPDAGATLTYALAGSWPAGLSVVGTQVVGTPTTPGTYASLTATAADGTNPPVPSNTFQITINPPATYSALADVVADAGIPLASGATVYWTWFPAGRPGSMASGVNGSGVVNAQARPTISHTVAGDGLVIIGTRPGPAVLNDRVFAQFLTLA